jgi:hypothetical protein
MQNYYFIHQFSKGGQILLSSIIFLFMFLIKCMFHLTLYTINTKIPCMWDNFMKKIQIFMEKRTKFIQGLRFAQDIQSTVVEC